LFVVNVIGSLLTNPLPNSLVLLAASWNHAMASLQLELAQLFMTHVPFLVTCRHRSQKALLKAKRRWWVDVGC
jgi:hypothetical protein